MDVGYDSRRDTNFECQRDGRPSLNQALCTLNANQQQQMQVQPHVATARQLSLANYKLC